MGLFSKRKSAPVWVGHAVCMVTPEGKAFVEQQNDPRIPSHAIAALAPITWALHLVRACEFAGTEAVGTLLHSLTRSDSAAEMNRLCNPGGVFAGAAPSGVQGLGAAGAFSILPTSDLTGTWNGPEGVERPVSAVRIYGALWHVAALEGSEGVVRHAVTMMQASFEESGGFARKADLHLPQMLLDHGAQMAAIDEARDAFPDLDSGGAAAAPRKSDGPPVRDWQVIRTSAGGFAPGTWHQYLHTSSKLADGIWQSMHSPSTDRLAVGFVADSGPRFFCPADEITSATVAAKGVNLAVEVRSEDGDFVCVGPRNRVREIFAGLGFAL